jgi:hypothetical protein
MKENMLNLIRILRIDGNILEVLTEAGEFQFRLYISII